MNICFCVLVPLWLFFPVYPVWVVINSWWEWPPAMITRVIAVKNRSHNPKTTDTKLQSFFSDQTGRFLGRQLG